MRAQDPWILPLKSTLPAVHSNSWQTRKGVRAPQNFELRHNLSVSDVNLSSMAPALKDMGTDMRQESLILAWQAQLPTCWL